MRSANLNHPLKHVELRNILREALVSGQLQPGDLVPSQNELSAKYGVSHNTVREAVGSLVSEGYLYRIQGKGTFVSDRKTTYLTVGLIIPHLWTSGARSQVEYDIGYIAQILHAVEEEAKGNGANLLLCLDNDDREMERQNLRDMINRRVDGIIISYIGEDENIDCLRRAIDAGIPLVLIDRYVEDLEASFIITDNRYGAYEATKALLERGYRKIYHFTDAENATTVNERAAGFQRALKEYAVPVAGTIHKTTVLSTDIVRTELAAHDLASEVLRDVNGPFAVFALNAPILVGVWRAIEEKGIPRDQYGLACFDQVPSTLPEGLHIVKVLQPLREMGTRSVQAILGNLAGDREPQHVILRPEIIK